ncbi:MAG: chaperone modulator CbpM [Betaproteobacteria bacterium]
MQTEHGHTGITHAVWMHRSQQVTIDELIALSGLSEMDLVELVDAGAMTPINAGVEVHVRSWTFTADYVPAVRKAGRLREELELDTHALVLAVKLLAQISELEGELAALRARQSLFGHR